MSLKYMSAMLAVLLVLVAPLAQAEQLSINTGAKVGIESSSAKVNVNANTAAKTEADIDNLKIKAEASKGDFLKIKAKTDTCKDAEPECIKAKGDLKIAAKDVIINHLDIVLGRLDRIKAIITAEATLPADESSKQLAVISQEISDINQLKENAGKITADTDKPVIKQLLKESNEKLGDIKANVDFSNTVLVNSRLKSAVLKTSSLLEKLNKVMEKMKQSGKDTTKIGQLIQDFTKKIDERLGRGDL